MTARAPETEPPFAAEPTLEVLVRDATKLFASWWLGDCGPCFLRVENARGEEETLLPLREQRAWKFLTVREPGTLYALSLVRDGDAKKVPLLSPKFIQMPSLRNHANNADGNEDVMLACFPDAHD
jgi:hypothetical protein